jgi:hypothetical protein
MHLFGMIAIMGNYFTFGLQIRTIDCTDVRWDDQTAKGFVRVNLKKLRITARGIKLKRKWDNCMCFIAGMAFIL